MNEQIYTIPINESFERQDGCPFCHLHETLQGQSIDYVLGAAMMEPNVRIETNKRGFCKPHYTALCAKNNRLSLALLLESHVDELTTLLAAQATDTKRGLKTLQDLQDSCFICERIALFMGHFYRNTAYLYRNEPAFAALFDKQPYFCLEHLSAFLTVAQAELSKKEFPALYAACLQKAAQHLKVTKDNVSEFCRSYDYRAAGQPLSEAAQKSIENAIAAL